MDSTGQIAQGQAVEVQPNAPTAPLRVSRIVIAGLFGLYNHEVNLHVDERVTILHGPNGVGKTALLRLIAAFFAGRYEEFVRYRFARLDIRFDDSSCLSIVDSTKASEKPGNIRFTVTLETAEGTFPSGELEFDSREILGWLLRARAEIPYIRFVGDDLWYDKTTGDDLTSLDAFYRYGWLALRRGIPRPLLGVPPWLWILGQRMPVHFIETQRLISRMDPLERSSNGSDAVLLPAVRDCAQDLSEQIQGTLARYGRQSQSMDQSFPQRLLKAVGQPSVDRSAIKAKMQEIDQRRGELQAIGLLDSTSTSPFDVASLDDLAPEQNPVMMLYIEDTQKKLAVLNDLAQRLTLLLSIINGKFRHKAIRIDRQKGFVVVGHDNAILDPDALSSGEQHELVLLYDLLFRVPKGSLVLIDEPELSLHVGWQKRFLPDLLEIVKLAEIDALIATHSPFIVGDRSDLMVALEPEIDA